MTGATGWRRRFDRAMDFTLWTDGGLFADERDRLRVLESTWVAACLQQHLIPWALVIAALVGPDVVVPYLAAVGLLYYLSWMVSWVYLARHRVPVEPPRYGAKFIVSLVLTNLPFVVLFGLWYDFTLGKTLVAVGLLLVLIAVGAVGERRTTDADTGEEPGGVAHDQVPARSRRHRWWVYVAEVLVVGLLGFAIGSGAAAVDADPFWLGVLLVGGLIVTTVVRQRLRRRTTTAAAAGEEPGR